jgi:transposase-like protein
MGEEIMGKERARYTPEFKDEAVRLVIESGRPIAQVAAFFARKPR